jgi:hypothetical protein
MHTIEEDTNLAHLTGPTTLDPSSSAGLRSGQYLGTGMATFQCVRAQANWREATQMEFMDLVFLLHATLGFW